MSTELECESHGKSEATYVCPHLLDSLNTGHVHGFNWLKDEEGEFQAFCDSCWNMSDEEWDADEQSGPKVLCLECFSEIAKLNDTRIGDQ